MRKHLLTRIALLWMVVTGPVAAAVNLEPNTLTVGNAGDITLTVDDGKTLTDIRLLPGGPYPEFTVKFDQAARDIAAINQRIYVAGHDGLGVLNRDGERLHHIASETGFDQLVAHHHTLIAVEGDTTVVTIDTSLTPPKRQQQLALNQTVKAISTTGHQIQILMADGSFIGGHINNSVISRFYDSPNKFEKSIKIKSEHDQLYALNDNRELVIYQQQSASTMEFSRYRGSDTVLDFTVADGTAYLATASGVTLVDVFDPQQPMWLGSHQQLGRVVQVTVHDGKLWARTDDHRLYALDIDNPSEPTVVAAYRSDHPITATATRGDRVYALTDHGLTAIDFTGRNPLTSNQGLDFGQGVNFGGERRAYIDNGLAYVADWFSGIHIYDLSNPRQPTLLTSFHTPGSPKGIVVRDGLAYVADDDHGLQVIDVSDPLNPRQVANLPTRGLGYTPKLVGDHLYLASHHGGFQIIDISTPAAPRLLSEYDTPGKAWSVAVRDQLAYVADDDTGLLIFDVGDPGQPQLIGQFSPGTAAEEVILDGDIAYVAFFEGPVVSLDIRDPRQPRVVGEILVPGNARGLDRIGDRLYVAGWLAGVHVLDISDPANMTLLGSHDTPGAAWGIYAREHYAYAMDWWGGLRVLDVTDPANIFEAGSYHGRGRVQAIAARDNYLFSAQGSNGLQVFDIKNPLNPTWTTGLSLPGQALDIAIDDTVAVVATGDGGLAVVDIGNPYQIIWRASLDLPLDPQRLMLHQNHAYLLDPRRGIAIVDIGTNNPPRLVAQLTDRGHALALAGDTLYLGGENGVTSYRLTQGRIVESRHYPINGTVRHLTVNDDHLYLGTETELMRLKHTNQGLREQQRTALPTPVRDIAVTDHQVMLIGDGDIVSLDRHNLAPLSRIPMLNRGTGVLHHGDVLYLAGENTITAIQTPPSVEFTNIADTGYRVTVPANLRLGDYDVSLTYHDATTTYLRNGLRIQQPKFSKPKLSWDAFQQILQEKKNTDLFTQPSP